MEGAEIRKHVVSIIVAIILIQPMISLDIAQTLSLNPSLSSETTYVASQYTESSPITIVSDSNFVDYGFLGSGTEEDPYVLSNVIINTTQIAITIMQTTSFFVIQDCIIYAGYMGISLTNVHNGVITDCRIHCI